MTPTWFDASYPPSVLQPAVGPTGATAGTPGSWTPAGSTVPADLAAANALGLSLGAAWTAGQYVVLGDASEAHWAGAAFVAGRAPTEDPEPEATTSKRRRKKTEEEEE